MVKQLATIPRPLVRANQFSIVIFIGLTWLFHNEFFLLVPLLSGLSGLIWQFNPVIELRRLTLRLNPSDYPQEDKLDQRFNQRIAVSLLTLSFISFIFNFAFLGYLFSILVFLAASIALLGFCIGCFLRFQYIQYRHKKQRK
ncbi:MAG: DUF4395 domain-containing protein [Streptococcaceae bacterium]|jgi:hypothetical protein|nr:DUF4395 domain-containing protein [Streptococcaceae bacterium]MCH4177051.1 DUF4395 domain-containing protein [Streptococcaceae bacterium]